MLFNRLGPLGFSFLDSAVDINFHLLTVGKKWEALTAKIIAAVVHVSNAR
jgi:hypothetical protein